MHTLAILITILFKHRHVSSSASSSNDEGIISTISTINNHTAGSGCTPLRVFLLQVLQSLQPSGKLLMMLLLSVVVVVLVLMIMMMMVRVVMVMVMTKFYFIIISIIISIVFNYLLINKLYLLSYLSMY
jgi:hypothetical protein